MRIRIPEPNNDIYDFKGAIEYAYTGADDGNQDDIEDVTNLQFVPRGSTVKFSEQVYGLVVYTGVETKLMQNLGSYRFKRSRMQQRIGYALMFNLCILVMLITISSIWNGIMTKDMYDSHRYIYDGTEIGPTEVTIQTILSLYLLYNYLVPLDLAVILEIVAIWYSFYLVNDYQMTHPKVGEKVTGPIQQARMNSLNLIENLGEVEYLMTDKTGTLTKNALTLVAASANPNTSFMFEKMTTFGVDQDESKVDM